MERWEEISLDIIFISKKYQMKTGDQRPDLYSVQVEKASETEFWLWKTKVLKLW